LLYLYCCTAVEKQKIRDKLQKGRTGELGKEKKEEKERKKESWWSVAGVVSGP
jgi:hypothetical protein